MIEKNIFSKITRNLLFYCMFYYVAHGIYFLGITNWSLYRSYNYEQDSCQIMFHGSECFFLYLVGVFLRIILLFSQSVITVERLIITIFPNSDLINSATLNMMSIIMSVITTSMIRPSTSSQFNSPNCFQQMFIGMKTIRSLIGIMIGFDVFCFPVNFIMMIRHRRQFLGIEDTHEYDLKSRYTCKTKLYSSIIVSFISFIQTLLYTIYIIAQCLSLVLYTNDDGMFYGNDVDMWFYTFPLAGLALPATIIVSYAGMTIRKNNKIGVMKVNNYTSQDAYFKNLNSQWNRSARQSIA
uniref:Serpentine receptor class gamma n=1 Tax=Caenorhabditis tropicalis TaxID=1561998 RepID=A0A1I7UMH2_9PELO